MNCNSAIVSFDEEAVGKEDIREEIDVETAEEEASGTCFGELSLTLCLSRKCCVIIKTFANSFWQIGQENCISLGIFFFEAAVADETDGAVKKAEEDCEACGIVRKAEAGVAY